MGDGLTVDGGAGFMERASLMWSGMKSSGRDSSSWGRQAVESGGWDREDARPRCVDEHVPFREVEEQLEEKAPTRASQLVQAS